jgi:hypothetical protein
MAKFIHTQDGGMEIHREAEVIKLTAQEVFAIYIDIRLKLKKEEVVMYIRNLDTWHFEQSKEDVIEDAELLELLVDDVNYDNIDVSNPNELEELLEQYLDINFDDI